MRRVLEHLADGCIIKNVLLVCIYYNIKLFCRLQQTCSRVQVFVTVPLATAVVEM